MKRFGWAVALLAAGTALSGCASTGGNGSGGTFPDSVDSIRLIVPFNAGGSTDAIARLVAPRLSTILDTPVQILNRPEGNGQTGLEEIATGPADGSVLGSTNLPSAIMSYLDPNTSVRYDRDSFTPVAGVAQYGEMIVVSASSPYQNLGDLLEAASVPRTLNLAAGAVDDLLPVTQFERAAGVEFNHVPFEGGSAGKVTALLGRKVDVITAAPNTVLPNVESGDFRVLATLGGERTPTFPDTPTIREAGVDAQANVLTGYSLPENTPENIVIAYSDALQEITEDPGFVDAVQATGFAVGFIGTPEFNDMWASGEADAETVLDGTP
ncbi:tripartite tricarboxylate transporter substrate binding protein [soil metagenome]